MAVNVAANSDRTPYWLYVSFLHQYLSCLHNMKPGPRRGKASMRITVRGGPLSTNRYSHLIAQLFYIRLYKEPTSAELFNPSVDLIHNEGCVEIDDEPKSESRLLGKVTP